MPDLREQLQNCCRGRVCFLGLGSVESGDDGFGVRLAEELASAGVPGAVVAGTQPDRHVSRIAAEGFDHLIFLDAVDFGGLPGSVVLLDSEAMTARFPQISTHKISLGLLAKWAEASGTTKVWLLGVQPESLKPVGVLTPAVQQTFEILAELLGEMPAEVSAQSKIENRKSEIPCWGSAQFVIRNSHFALVC